MLILKLYGRVSVEIEVDEELFKKDIDSSVRDAVKRGRIKLSYDDDYLPQPWNEDYLTEDEYLDLPSGCVIKMEDDEMDIEELYQELSIIYDRYKPNDEQYLENHPELVEEIKTLDSLEPSNEEEASSALRNLTNFIEEWFPDSVDEEEQERIRDILESAYKVI